MLCEEAEKTIRRAESEMPGRVQRAHRNNPTGFFTLVEERAPFLATVASRADSVRACALPQLGRP